MAESRSVRREKFLAVAGEPEFIEELCDKISDGETLSDICRKMNIKFRWMYAWLNDEELPERKAKYIEAENARDAMSKEDVLGQIHRLSNIDVRRLFDEHGDLLPAHKLPDDIAKAVSSIDVTENEKGEVTKKVRFVDRGQMLTLGGRRHRMFVDRVENTGSMTLEQAVTESLKPRDV